MPLTLNIANFISDSLSLGPSGIAHKSSGQVDLNNKTVLSNTMQGATSVPLLTVDTVVSVTGNDNANDKANETTATTVLIEPPSFRKLHKSGGDDEGDSAKGVTFKKSPFYRQPSRRSLQLIRGPSRYIHITGGYEYSCWEIYEVSFID